jgi:DNA-directed RNA polymerase subunit RPC12/RpoP
MELKAAICNNCGGQIQVDISKLKGFCMHCGSEIIINDVIKEVSINRDSEIENLLKTARSALEANDFEYVREVTRKGLEINYDNFEFKILDLRAIIGISKDVDRLLQKDKLSAMGAAFINENTIPLIKKDYKTKHKINIDKVNSNDLTAWMKSTFSLNRSFPDIKSSLDKVFQSCKSPDDFVTVLRIVDELLYDFLLIPLFDKNNRLIKYWEETFEIILKRVDVNDIKNNYMVRSQLDDIVQLYVDFKYHFNLKKISLIPYKNFEISIFKLSNSIFYPKKKSKTSKRTLFLLGFISGFYTLIPIILYRLLKKTEKTKTLTISLFSYSLTVLSVIVIGQIYLEQNYFQFYFNPLVIGIQAIPLAIYLIGDSDLKNKKLKDLF